MKFLFEGFTEQHYVLLFKYILVFLIVVGSLILRSLEYKKLVFLRNDRNLLIIFCVFIIIFSGTRGYRIGTDTYNYYMFYYIKGLGITNIFTFLSYFKSDFLFEVLAYITFQFKNYTVFLMAVSIIINGCLYMFVRKFTDFGNAGSSLLFFLTIASSFSFLSIEINIIRNGLSIGFVLLGLYYLDKKFFKKCIIFFIIGYLFHRTAVIPIFIAFSAYFGWKVQLKYYLALYLLFIGLSFVGFGFDKISILSSISGEDFKRLAFQGETTYRIGFRYDFVLYNSFFLFLFIKFSDLKNRTDLFFIRFYILASIVFFMNFNIPFSDRIGLYSWIIIPILLFNTIKNSFPKKQLYYSSLAALFYCILNHFILFS
ncbi:hypothetical protein HME9304_02836 [Flagellimonas maritima]|uniref:EpsG family protein n=1 Tax=Flagellimonas maritima TaxID=1383885 RepID=A0A2Z4LVF9_9FLAO|nr:EpsG family protein [Allomuricauda aurantiaca]AWX45806.1 hypothetical protein HME9304_02836 [Allomuricauda aurantiaca]